ncbi:MAG: SPFH domain-containing protein [Betaproteobacteria bacterium]|nr:SPFH domain-containing protein [Betaproteobacteria bacterium]
MELDHTPRTPTSEDAPRSPSRKEKTTEFLKHGLQSVQSIRLPWRRLTLLGALGLAIYGIAMNPPVESVASGEVGLRVNQWTGSSALFQEGQVLVIPMIHELRSYSLHDRTYQQDGKGGLSFQSAEGLPLDADLAVRYTLDVERLPVTAQNLPDNIDSEIMQPVIQSLLQKTLASYTAREIFSSHQIKDEISRELQTRLNEDGLKIKAFTLEFHSGLLRDMVYKPDYSEKSSFSFQSSEGLPLEVDLAVHYALDLDRLPTVARKLPNNINKEIMQPLIQRLLQETFLRHTAHEIFLSQRQEIQDEIKKELHARLNENGLKIKTLTLETRSDLLRERIYQPDSDRGSGFSFQSAEGLTLDAELTVRYVVDIDMIPTKIRGLLGNIDNELVLPIIRSALYKAFSRKTVREIFSSHRQEILNDVTKELRAQLSEEGIKLKSITMGKINLPPDYVAGMEKVLAAEAEKVRREKVAEAAAQEQIIAAQAQAEAMKHILPFKEKQIKQRELEAEAARLERVKIAEANAEARIIEAAAEADSRKKLADAEVYRMDQVGKINIEQMAREGEIIMKSPLLIQKTLAEKLSEKVQVIVVPPGTDGRFVGENLIGRVQ